MSSTYNGNAGGFSSGSTFQITIPSDGDAANVASVNNPGPFEPTADAVEFFREALYVTPAVDNLITSGGGSLASGWAIGAGTGAQSTYASAGYHARPGQVEFHGAIHATTTSPTQTGAFTLPTASRPQTDKRFNVALDNAGVATGTPLFATLLIHASGSVDVIVWGTSGGTTIQSQWTLVLDGMFWNV